MKPTTEAKLETLTCPSCGRPNAAEARFCGHCGARLTQHPSEFPEADPLIGRTIADRYRILSLLGRGGMGVVYKVEHIHIGKFMAIKLLHGELARDRETIRRFRREAEAASQLSHPNTVQTFDFGSDQGLMYLVMEYVEGRDLGSFIAQEGALPFPRVARICAQVCESVGEAHAKGIVHRDLKPENIMVIPSADRPDVAKVLDFGLAKLRHQDGSQTVTRAGAIVGTPYYMAPEHIRGDDVDARADIYSLGAVIYKAVTGTPPYSASSPVGVLTKALTEELEAPSQRIEGIPLPPEVDAIVMRAMRKDAQERYQSMGGLRSDLLDYLASVGEEVGDPALSGRSVSGSPSSRARPRLPQVATRGDIDSYEKRIKRRSYAWVFLAGFALAALGMLGYELYSRRSAAAPKTAEREPNNTPDEASPLPSALAVEGTIGRRLAPNRGDVDIYRIDHRSNRSHARVELTPLPNMDLAVDIFRQGNRTPALVADSRGVGEGELLPNFPFGRGVYFLRVREVRKAQAPPTENVSDRYTVHWTDQTGETDDAEEQEFNDSLELANELKPQQERRGFLGWAGDVDTYCLAADEAEFVVEVDGVADLDVVMRVVDRVAHMSRKVNRAGSGQAEVSDVIQNGKARQTCVELSAARGQHPRANPDVPYVLRMKPAAQ